MDIHQLRSWIFELYEPLENERQYIVYDGERGNLLIDAPPFSERALRLVRGAGPASLLVATNAARAADAAKYREALGLQVAVHADDAEGIPGGPDLVLSDDELVRPDARAVRVHANGEAAAAGVEVIARERALAALVQLAPRIEREGMGGDDGAAAQKRGNLRGQRPVHVNQSVTRW